MPKVEEDQLFNSDQKRTFAVCIPPLSFFIWAVFNVWMEGPILGFYHENIKNAGLIYNVVFVVIQTVEIISFGFGVTFFFLMLKEYPTIIKNMQRKFLISIFLISFLCSYRYPHEMLHYKYLTMKAIVLMEYAFHLPVCCICFYLSQYQSRLYNTILKTQTFKDGDMKKAVFLGVVFFGIAGATKPADTYEQYCGVPNILPGWVEAGLVFNMFIEGLMLGYAVIYGINMARIRKSIPTPAIKRQFTIHAIAMTYVMGSWLPHTCSHVFMIMVRPNCPGQVWNIPATIYLAYEVCFHIPVALLGWVIAAQMYTLIRKVIKYSQSDMRGEDEDDTGDSLASSADSATDDSSASGSSSSASSSSDSRTSSSVSSSTTTSTGETTATVD